MSLEEISFITTQELENMYPNDTPKERENKITRQKGAVFLMQIGGGIGQSRICMFFLRKAHIGEVQSSIWPDEVLKEAEEKGIILL